MIRFRAAALAPYLLLGVTGAQATTQIAVSSYDMPNGDGQPMGSANYWDRNYGGASHTTNGEALSGGTGDLTDGFVPADYWYALETLDGSGPYVGWVSNGTLNPTITFHFAGTPAIDTIMIHMDNTGFGGVNAPTLIKVDGIDTAFTLPAHDSIGWATASGLNLTGQSHTIQLFNPGIWVFVSEVTFFGTTAPVPEPASWALMIAGFGLAGGMLRKRVRPVLA